MAYNVRAFGAQGNGMADDTAALQVRCNRLRVVDANHES